MASSDDAAPPPDFEGSFLRIPTATVSSLLERGAQVSQRVLGVLHSAVDASVRSATALKRPLQSGLFDGEVPGCSLRHSLSHLHQYSAHLSDQHARHAGQLEKSVRKPFDAAVRDVQERVLHARMGLRRSTDKVRQKEDTLKRRKARRDKAVRALSEARDRLGAAASDLSAERVRLASLAGGAPPAEQGLFGPKQSLLESLSQRAEKLRGRAAKAAALLNEAEEQFEAARSELLSALRERDAWQVRCAAAFQGAEEDRRSATRGALLAFFDLEERHLRSRLESLRTVRSLFEEADVAKDMEHVVRSFGDEEGAPLQCFVALDILRWDEQHRRNSAEGATADEESPHDSSDAPKAPEASDLAPSPPPGAAEGAPAPGGALHAASEGETPPFSPKNAAESAESAAESAESAAESAESAADKPENAAEGAEGPPPKASAGEDGARRLTMAILRGECGGAAALAAAMIDKSCRDGFLETLNDERLQRCDLSGGGAWDALAGAFTAFLDACAEASDVGAARHLMNMANSFYRSVPEGPGGLGASGAGAAAEGAEDRGGDRESESESEANRRGAGESEIQGQEAEGVGGPAEEGVGGPAEERAEGLRRQYLHEVCASHRIWRTEQFWEDALLVAVGEQLRLSSAELCGWESAVLSSGSDGPDLREAVRKVHNALFAEIATTAIYMRECGLEEDRVLAFVASMCTHCQLPEAMAHRLFRNAAGPEAPMPPALRLRPERARRAAGQPPPRAEGALEEAVTRFTSVLGGIFDADP